MGRLIAYQRYAALLYILGTGTGSCGLDVLVNRQCFGTITGDGDVVLLLDELLKSAVAVPLHILMVHSSDVSEYSLFVCREADGDECGCEHSGATLHCVARSRVHVEDLGVQLVVVHLEVHAEGSCQDA
jgi:hypothetical protein